MKQLFTKRKFLALGYQQQHKKCAELLKKIYIGKTKGNLEHYNEIQEWIKLPGLEVLDFKDIADRYHIHLREADVSLKEHSLLPKILKNDRDEALLEPLPIAIYLDKIRSAHNIGSILRTTENLSLGTVYFGENMAFKDNKQVKDAAMGAEQWVKCIKETSLEKLPKPIIVLETAKNAKDLYDFTFPDVFTLVLGNEEYGCSENSLQQADEIIAIPSVGRKNSLNVANAFAIVAGEIFRQKRVFKREK